MVRRETILIGSERPKSKLQCSRENNSFFTELLTEQWYRDLLTETEHEQEIFNKNSWYQGLPTLENHPDYPEIKKKVAEWQLSTEQFVRNSLRSKLKQ